MQWSEKCLKIKQECLFAKPCASAICSSYKKASAGTTLKRSCSIKKFKIFQLKIFKCYLNTLEYTRTILIEGCDEENWVPKLAFLWELNLLTYEIFPVTMGLFLVLFIWESNGTSRN